MILYFTGTGNSAYAAKFINTIIRDEVVNLFDKIKDNDYSDMASDKPWIIVAPTYCWQLPRLLEDWIIETAFKGSRDVYFIMTCGSDVGNAEKYLRKLCKQKNLNYKGCAEIVMPENYIALFNVPDKNEAKQIIKKAEKELVKTAELIRDGNHLNVKKANLAGKLSSGPINKIYYPLIVKDKKFYAENNCNSCGICVKKCPLNNISLSKGKPKWNGNCTHCMACIAYCPQEAIEYGRASKGKERYTCPTL